jgi:hypothetical protein
MKKYILLLMLLVWGLFINKTFAENDETYFVVTAYYSPLPDQEHYSYSVYTQRERTFEEEKRLQWEWIRWASWKKVFSWMLAAPKNYKFWTKIFIEWLWTWEVADRWWAIVNKWVRWHWYDRIDVWMWYGDEWLRRATYWGKRTVKGKFLNRRSKVDLDFSNIALANLPSYSKINSYSKLNKKKVLVEKKVDIFSKKITTKQEYIRLQEVLTELNLYSGSIDWNYDNIIDVIYDFQLKNKIVKSRYSPWAWSYWPITRSTLNNHYKVFLQRKEEERLELVRLQKEKEKEEARKKELIKKYDTFKKIAYNKADSVINNIWTPKKWDVSHWVRLLQKKLSSLGYFKYKDTAIYWNITKESIIAFQLDKNIIKSKNELWAWIFWPKTKKALKEDLKKLFFQEIVKKENIDIDELVLVIKEKA